LLISKKRQPTLTFGLKCFHFLFSHEATLDSASSELTIDRQKEKVRNRTVFGSFACGGAAFLAVRTRVDSV
jgi:hypothetical protein